MGALRYKEQYLCRARSLENGEWVYGNFVEMVIDSRQTAYIYPYPKNANSGNHAYTPQPIECKLDTVGRYTGSTDYNGEDIFEGDWVVLPNGQHGKVVFELSTWMVAVIEGIEYDELEEHIPEHRSAEFHYNDNCISFLELFETFCPEAECDSQMEVLCLVENEYCDPTEDYMEAWNNTKEVDRNNTKEVT